MFAIPWMVQYHVDGLHGIAPSNMRSCLAAGSYNLKAYAKLKVPAVTTTKLGLHSSRYQALHVWNNLQDEVHRTNMLTVFKQKVKR